MKDSDFIDQVWDRIKNPFFGYLVFSFLIINWDSVFFLFFSDSSAEIRIEYFNDTTNFWFLLVFPFLSSAGLAIFVPWINYSSLWISTKPNELINSLQASSENKFLIKQQKLEVERSRLVSEYGDSIIEQAKKFDELDRIENEEARNEAKRELEEIRTELQRQRKELLSNNNEKYINPLNEDEIGTWTPDITLLGSDKEQRAPLKLNIIKANYEFISRTELYHLEFDITFEVDDTYLGSQIIINGLPFVITNVGKPISSVSLEINSRHKIAYVTVFDPLSLVIVEESNGFLNPLKVGESWKNIKISGNFSGQKNIS